MGKSNKKHSHEHSTRGSFGKLEAIIFIVLTFALLAYYFVQKANGEDVDEYTFGGTIFAFIVLMGISISVTSPSGRSGGKKKKKAVNKGKKRRSGKGPAPVKAPPPTRAQVVAEKEEEEKTKKEYKIISYPKAASGGQYGDAFIPISDEVILKVRSLLAVSCKNCKDREDCWEKYQDQMDYDTFLASTECFEEMAPEVIAAVPPEIIAGEPEETVEEEIAVDEGWGTEEEVAVDTEETDLPDMPEFGDDASETDEDIDFGGDWDSSGESEDDETDEESSSDPDESDDEEEEDFGSDWG